MSSHKVGSGSGVKAGVKKNTSRETRSPLGNYIGRNAPRNTPEASARAKARWQAILGKVVQENASHRAAREYNSADEDQEEQHRHKQGLIDEIRKAKQRSKVKESVLSVLKSQAHLTQKQFERQKYSAKEILVKKRYASKGMVAGLNLSSGDSKRNDANAELMADYTIDAQLRYPITPKIQAKLDKIKEHNRLKEEKQAKHAEHPGRMSILGFFAKLLGASIMGQTLMANPRFYKMDPHEHLPELCRRCRRPLIDTLESHFTTVGILFCVFLPIMGIPLLFANREFVCVACEEIYVYGDLTARPVEEYDE